MYLKTIIKIFGMKKCQTSLILLLTLLTMSDIFNSTASSGGN